MVQSDVVCYFFVSSVSVLIEKIPVVRYLILGISIEYELNRIQNDGEINVNSSIFEL